ncbi:MAG: hypothetical protein M0R39_03990 [Prolixibacteraceae bacterium]|nr:hypothetical protein [Prolixibacteraceae bacterium]
MFNIDHSTEGLLYKIAISLVPGIGSVTAKSLIAYCCSAGQHRVNPSAGI